MLENFPWGPENKLVFKLTRNLRKIFYLDIWLIQQVMVTLYEINNDSLRKVYKSLISEINLKILLFT